jgi:hypothetical protein
MESAPLKGDPEDSRPLLVSAVAAGRRISAITNDEEWPKHQEADRTRCERPERTCQVLVHPRVYSSVCDQQPHASGGQDGSCNELSRPLGVRGCGFGPST